MGDLTQDFNASEFRCPCGACDGGQMDKLFMAKLQQLRSAAGVPLRIDSGFRCPAHNKAVGGEPDSLHLKGRAADVAVGSGSERYKLLGLAISGRFMGIGVARDYIHVDDRRPADGVPYAVIWTYYPK